MYQIRPYTPADLEDVLRIWREVGWATGAPQDPQRVQTVVAAGAGTVGLLDDSLECFVATAPGNLRYQDETLRFACISTVSTGRAARRQGIAGRTTAAAVAQSAEDGAQIAGLTTFDLGYYNRMGFGTGNYMHQVTFDAARLTVPDNRRVPVRLGEDDWRELHAARLQRIHHHGYCDLFAPEATRMDVFDPHASFGLGYRNAHGQLTHYIWFMAEHMRYGPYHIRWLVYRDRAEFLELMGMLRNLGDQVHAVRIWEPPSLRVLDLVQSPRSADRLTKGGEFASGIDARLYWQMRILDLVGCLEKTVLTGGAVDFNLYLTDPIERFLPVDAPWRGIGGRYRVHLGAPSHAQLGEDPNLPTLTASVGAFTRLWLGVLPAGALVLTDELAGPPELIDALDRVVRLPIPDPDWMF
ncbi:MAG: GNAT family N-acetyltransferase [Caldilineaceae bacterium]